MTSEENAQPTEHSTQHSKRSPESTRELEDLSSAPSSCSTSSGRERRRATMAKPTQSSTPTFDTRLAPPTEPIPNNEPPGRLPGGSFVAGAGFEPATFGL